MSPSTPDSESSATPRATYMAFSASCPLFLLGLVGYLVSRQGTRALDAFAARNFLAGMMVVILPTVVMGAIMLVGVATSIRSVRRREKPAWGGWAVLAVNGAILLVALVALFLAM